jgi:hypothetical protein
MAEILLAYFFFEQLKMNLADDGLTGSEFPSGHRDEDHEHEATEAAIILVNMVKLVESIGVYVEGIRPPPSPAMTEIVLFGAVVGLLHRPSVSPLRCVAQALNLEFYTYI